MVKFKGGLAVLSLGVLLLPTVAPIAQAEQLPSETQAPLRHGPETVSDLVEGLMDAVVNISITQSSNTEGDEGVPTPTLPQDAPFQDLFDDYFKNRSDEGANTARKVTSLGSGFVIDPAGYIVTNNHVIEGASEIMVNFADR